MFSICIPSYNRGQKAFQLVKELLNYIDLGEEEIEVICSNNGSVKGTEGYKKLSALKDSRFHYHEFSENKGFAANLSQVIKMAKGTFCMLMSDEDKLIGKNLGNYIKFLKLHSELGLVKCCTSLVYADIKTIYAPAGEQALEQFYMYGNYISGTIYNRNIITDELLEEYARRYGENAGYIHYPHLFFDAVSLVQGDFCSSDLLLIEEGVPADTFSIAENGPDHTISVYATYESRLEQMHGYTKQIIDLEIAPTMKFQMFIRVLERIIEQINIPKKNYIRSGEDWSAVMQMTADRMKEEMRNLKLPFSNEDEKIVCEYIESITVGKER